MPKPKEWLSDAGIFLLGGSAYALAVNVFTVPANIAPGGATGLAVLLHHLFRLPVGIGIVLLNLPLFGLSVQRLGKRFLWKSLIATLLLSLLIDLSAIILPVYRGSRLLASLYAGVLSGWGIALILLRGATTGGSDIAAKLLVKQFPSLRVAPTIFAIDGLVIGLSALVYNDIDSALYACLMIFTATIILDRFLYQAGMGKMAIIITKQGDAIARQILQQLGRGCTRLEGTGAYSATKRHVLLCVSRRSEVWRLKQLVKQVDPHSFVAICEANQVLGEGFSVIS